MVKGFHLLPGFNFIEIFSPVIKLDTIRIILTLALTFKWLVQKIDVNNSLLNGFTKDIYMAQPPGSKSTNKDMICKLNRSLCGLDQAPGAWYKRLADALLHFGFVSSYCDSSLFIYSKHGTTSYVLIYDDDILIIGSSATLVQDLITQLNAKFALKQHGN